MRDEILKALQTLRNSQGKKGFVQSVDLIVALKGLDLKRPESKFAEDFILPHGRGKDAEVVVFSDNLTGLDCQVFNSDDLQKVAANKRSAKKLGNRTDFFLSEASLMPLIGRVMGQVLAPRNKMPKVITGDAKRMVANYKKSVRLIVKSAPVVQCIVGKEDMAGDKVAENVAEILKFLETKLPRGRQNMGKVLLKFTMGEPVKVEVN
ncbi:MAG: 50S ribosomal protein L1 [Candidatus Aenigmarchaeota archaeon]|nr:50S ribosomal protein L1 [Candidatus Aenigmarchaeota archaeon]